MLHNIYCQMTTNTTPRPQLKKEGEYFVDKLMKTEILYHFITVYVLNKYFFSNYFSLFNREMNTKCKGICYKYMSYVHTPFNLLMLLIVKQ